MQAIRNFATSRHLVLIGLILACALSRLLPHPWNFSPIESVALFAGAVFASRTAAVLVPMAAMLLSDLVLGFHGTMPVVYGCMAVIALAGGKLGAHAGPGRIALFGLCSAVFFFIATNFAVWLGQGIYPLDFGGLLACYVAAIPFFHNQLAGVAVYSTVLFGALALLRRRQPALATG
jgi:hypothetical protein